MVIILIRLCRGGISISSVCSDGRRYRPTGRESGEMPCAYVELIKGSEVPTEELIKHVEKNIGEKAAIPKHFDIVDEMPKTPIGKILNRN